jgi:hypothetical protein
MEIKFGMDKYGNIVFRRGYFAESGNRVIREQNRTWTEIQLVPRSGVQMLEN